MSPTDTPHNTPNERSASAVLSLRGLSTGLFTGPRTHQPHQVPPGELVEVPPVRVVDNTVLIVVRMHAPGRPRWRESFLGKWFPGDWVDGTYDRTGLVWRVGLTATGRLVGYRAVTDDHEQRRQRGFSEATAESLLLTFATADEFSAGVVRAGFPSGVLDLVLNSVAFGVVHHHAEW